MKRISELFTDEEKNQVSYLGSMLRWEPTEEEAEQPEGSRLVCRQQRQAPPQGRQTDRAQRGLVNDLKLENSGDRRNCFR
jgi:hypothetical protein